MLLLLFYLLLLLLLSCVLSLCFEYLSSGDRVVVVIVLSVMSMNSSPPDPITSGMGVVLWEQVKLFLCKQKTAKKIQHVLVLIVIKPALQLSL